MQPETQKKHWLDFLNPLNWFKKNSNDVSNNGKTVNNSNNSSSSGRTINIDFYNKKEKSEPENKDTVTKQKKKPQPKTAKPTFSQKFKSSLKTAAVSLATIIFGGIVAVGLAFVPIAGPLFAASVATFIFVFLVFGTPPIYKAFKGQYEERNSEEMAKSKTQEQSTGKSNKADSNITTPIINIDEMKKEETKSRIVPSSTSPKVEPDSTSPKVKPDSTSPKVKPSKFEPVVTSLN